MIQQAQDVLLGLDVSVKIGPKDALLPDCFESIELRLFIAFDKVNFSKGTFSYLLVELEGRQRDCLDFLILSDELVELEDVLLPPELHISFLLLLLSLRNYFLDIFVLQHFLNHRAVVGPVPVHRILFLNFPFSLVLLE